MTDRTLLAVLAYRIKCAAEDGNLSSETYSLTVVAKHGHAPRKELVLFEGPGGDYSEIVRRRICNDPPSVVCTSGEIGGFKAIQFDNESQKVVYGVDVEGIGLAVLTGRDYPTRVARKMLTELHQKFASYFGRQAKSASTDSLTRQSKSLLSALCKKYDDPSYVDKVAALQEKAEEVKEIVHSSIVEMQENVVKGEDILARAEHLETEAAVFDTQAKRLRNTMKCKSLKMSLVLVAVVIVIVAGFILSFALNHTEESNDSKET